MMRFKRTILLLLLGTITFIGCKPNELNVEKYLNFFQDPSNGLIGKSKNDNYQFVASIRSRDYMTLIQMGEESLLATNAELDSARKLVEDMTYVLVKINRINKANNFMVENELYYYTNNFLKKVFLKSGDEIVPCIISNLESSINDEQRTLILGFTKDLSSLKSPLSLCINSERLTEGELCISFEKFKTNNIPKLVAE